MKATSSQKRKGWVWPVAIALVLLLSAGSNIAVMLVARNDLSFAIEPDYYQKALHWDEVMEQEQRNLALGWSIDARIELGSESRPGRVVILIRDSSGHAVDGAQVQAVAFHNARAAQRLSTTLHEEAPGTYTATLDADRPGLWDVAATAMRGRDLFVETVRLNVNPSVQ